MIEQRSPEWFAARAGKCTASRIADVMAKLKSGGESASRANYRAQLVAERLTGRVEESFQNAAMKWGTEAEPLARAAYEADRGVIVAECGLIDHPRIAMAGASPDGLVGTDGVLEIKCPNTATHIATLLKRDAPAEYAAQMLWQMACTGRQWCDFVSFDPRMPAHLQLFVQRVDRDDAALAAMEAEVERFLGEVDATVEALSRLAA
jgi:putative phage-type endonuclease